MTYKILLIKNRYSKKVNFQKAFDWFKKNANLDIVVDEMKTDFDVTGTFAGNASWQGAVCDASLVPKLKTVVPENKYNAVIFLYGNTLNGVSLSCVNGAYGKDNLYPNTEVIQLAVSKWEVLNHEIIHAFFQKANRFGANIYDNMDTYYRDNILDTDNGDTNRTIALRTLKPHWNTIVSLKEQPKVESCKQGELYDRVTGAKCPQVKSSLPIVTIVRKATKKQTTGILTASNAGASFACKTVERPWLNNANSISCIPTGTYQVKWTFSPKFMKYTYQVMDVPNRSGIRVHSANFYSQLEGCIALGDALVDINADGELDTINSKKTIALFENFMQKKPFTLIIK